MISDSSKSLRCCNGDLDSRGRRPKGDLDRERSARNGDLDRRERFGLILLFEGDAFDVWKAVWCSAVSSKKRLTQVLKFSDGMSHQLADTQCVLRPESLCRFSSHASKKDRELSFLDVYLLTYNRNMILQRISFILCTF